MTVSIAVTNRASISTLKKVPRMANVPTTTTTSWSRATRAVAPNFTSRKRNVIQARIPIEPRMTSRIACWVSSWLITGPTVVSVRCESIGPRAACSAVAISPNLPLVGRVWLPSTGAGLGLALGFGLDDAVAAPADDDGAGVGLGDALGAGLGEALGAGLGEALGAGLGDALGAGLALEPGLPLAPAEAAGLAEGIGVGGGVPRAAVFVSIW